LNLIISLLNLFILSNERRKSHINFKQHREHKKLNQAEVDKIAKTVLNSITNENNQRFKASSKQENSKETNNESNKEQSKEVS